MSTYEPTEEARWHARWFQICMSARVDPDHIDSPHLLVDAILRANSCYKLKSRHAALVEALDLFFQSERQFPSHSEWAETDVVSLQQAHAAAQDQGNAD